MSIQVSRNFCFESNGEALKMLLEKQANTAVTNLDFLKKIWEKALLRDPSLNALKISRKRHNIPNSCYVLRGKRAGELIFQQQYHASLPNQPKVLQETAREQHKRKIGEGSASIAFLLRGLGGSPDYVRTLSRNKGKCPISNECRQFYLKFRNDPYLTHGPVILIKGREVRFSPFMKRGTLSDTITGEKSVKFAELDSNQRIKIFLDIAKGIQILHKEGWVHGDIKEDNIVLDDNLSASLIDFQLVEHKHLLNQEANICDFLTTIHKMYEISKVEPPEEIKALCQKRLNELSAPSFPKIDEIISCLQFLLPP